MILKIDKQGRIVVPKAIRELIGIKLSDNVKLELEGEKLIITKVE